MKIDVRFFASVREGLGAAESVELAAGGDVAVLRDTLASRGGRYEELLGRQRVVRSARNRVLCAESEVLTDGDEVGFFPPVTGG
ncbi:MAG: MoaD/ThiS family protein [Pseudomonadota bacterium]|nr:MoaD/ThiS family protein [Pseudomonadota bacterium]